MQPDLVSSVSHLNDGQDGAGLLFAIHDVAVARSCTHKGGAWT